MMSEAIKFFGVIFLSFFLILGSTLTPILYLEGSAKAKWIKVTRNVDLAWYEAAFLDIQYSDIEANLSIKH